MAVTLMSGNQKKDFSQEAKQHIIDYKYENCEEKSQSGA
jgi:hypothetical protein